MSGTGADGWVGVTSGVIASGFGANAEYVSCEPIARAIATTETTTASRLSFFLRVPLVASNSCLAANLASLSRSEEFPMGAFVKIDHLPLIGFPREFTKLFPSFRIALWL
jgi:hypothetical protein